MIRRLLLFAALATAGIWGLYLITPVADAGGSARNALTEEGEQDVGPFARDEGAGQGVSVGSIDSRGSSIPIDATLRGRVEIPSRRRIPYGNGFRTLRTYQLDAADSRPVGDGERMELEDIVLTWFEVGVDDAGVPIEVRAGELRARRGFLGVGRDDRGRPSIREDRDMDLREVEVHSLPTSTRLAPMTMRVARMSGRQTDRGLVLFTPTENEPFDLEIGGDQRARMTGRGVRLALPPEARLRGETPTGTLELDVRHDPVLLADGIEVRADGPLLWRERMDTQAATVTLDGDVNIRYVGARNDASTDAAEFVGTGEHFTATLVRAENGGGGGLSWRALELTGVPDGDPVREAELRDGRGSVLRALRIVAVSPGGFGDSQPTNWVATSDGRRPVTVEFHDRRQGADDNGPVVFRAAERVSAYRIANLHEQLQARWLGPALAPRIPWPSTFRERLVFEGETHVEFPTDDLTLDCVDGLVAWVGDSDGGDRLRLRTDGAFDLASADLTAQGSAGFTLFRHETAGVGTERLRVGPSSVEHGDDEPSFAIHRTVARGTDREGSLAIAGHGVCEFVRPLPADRTGTTTFRVASRTADVSVEFESTDLERGTQGRLTDLASLTGSMVESGALETIRGLAGDVPCTIDVRAPGGDRIRGEGLEVRRSPRGVFQLLGSPARLALGDEAADLTGASIHVAPVQAGRPMILATDPTGAVGNFRGGLSTNADGRQPGDDRFVVRAPRLRYVPQRVPEAVLRAHGVPIQPWFAASARSPWMFASSALPSTDVIEGDVERAPLVPVTLEQIEVGTDGGSERTKTLATGTRLAVRLPGDVNRSQSQSEDAEAVGVLEGEPARLERRNDTQRMVALGARVRFRTSDETLLLEPLTGVEGIEKAGLSTLYVFGFSDQRAEPSARDTKLLCDGPIEVFEDRIAFGGPVEANGLLPDGSVDPRGLDLEAESLELERDRATGAVLRGVADRDVDIAWNGVHALADRVQLDLQQHEFLAESLGERPVRVRLGEGAETQTRRALVNYRTRTWILWRARTFFPDVGGISHSSVIRSREGPAR